MSIGARVSVESAQLMVGLTGRAQPSV